MALPKIPSLMPGDGGDVMGSSSLLLGDTQPWGNQGREGRAREGIPAQAVQLTASPEALFRS